MAPRGNHGSPGRAFSVWRRRRPTGPSAGPFVGGARSKRFPGQYTIICVCCSVALTITEAHCYGAFAKRPVEFTPRFSQGARVLSDVRAWGIVSRSTSSWKVRMRWWSFSTEGSSEVFAGSRWSSCRARIQSSSGAMSICSGQHRYPDRCFTDDGAGGSQFSILVRPGWRNRPQLWSV